LLLSKKNLDVPKRLIAVSAKKRIRRLYKLELAFGDGFFHRIPDKPVIPLIAKGLFGPDNRP
jgi:hypothetical protein